MEVGVMKLSGQKKNEPNPLVETTLASGVRVLMHRTPGVPASTFMLWVTSGSRHESEEEAGTSHLLEHLLLESHFDSSSITKSLESLGIQVNGFTGKENTVFFSRQSPDLCPQAIKFLTEAVLKPALDVNLLDREREVVLQEIRANESEASDYVFEIFHAAMFLPDAIARPTTGTPHSLLNLDLESINEFHQKRFHSGTIRAIVTGDFSPDHIIDSLENSSLSTLKHEDWLPSSWLRGRTAFSADVSRKFDDDFSYVIFGFEVSSATDLRRPALEVLDALLGGSSSSILFEAIRTREALSYEIWSDLIFYTDRGAWLTFLSTPAEHVDQVLQITHDAMAKALQTGWTDEQIVGAKNYAASKLVTKSDPSSGHAMQIGQNRVTFGLDDWTTRNHVKAIREVSSAMLIQAMEELTDRRPVVAVCGGTTAFKTGFLDPWQS